MCRGITSETVLVFTPVSYTHLDVYKRQIVVFVFGSKGYVFVYFIYDCVLVFVSWVVF